MRTFPARLEPHTPIRRALTGGLLAAGLLLATLLSVVACSSDRSDASSAGAVFAQMIEAVQDVQSARAEITIDVEVAAGETHETATLDGVVDFQRPDRMRLSAELSTESGFAGHIDAIAVGTELYVKPPMSDEWIKPPTTNALFTMDPSSDVNPLAAIAELDPADFGDLTLLPRETVDGILTERLRFTANEQGLLGLLDSMSASGDLPSMDAPDMPDDLDIDLQVDLWIGVDDHLPLRETVTGTLAAGETPDAVSITALVTFSRYGEDPGIRPPETAVPALP